MPLTVIDTESYNVRMTDAFSFPLLPSPLTIITTAYTHTPACHFRHSFQTLRHMDTRDSSLFGGQQLRYVRTYV